MDEQKRKRLAERREALKIQRKKEGRLALIDALTKWLSEKQYPFRVTLENELSRHVGSLPFLFSGFDWANIAGSESRDYHHSNERDAIIAATVSKFCEPGDEVLVAFSNGARPELFVDAVAVILHPAIFADTDMDFWLYKAENGFLMECYHEGQISWVLQES